MKMKRFNFTELVKGKYYTNRNEQTFKFIELQGYTATFTGTDIDEEGNLFDTDEVFYFTEYDCYFYID